MSRDLIYDREMLSYLQDVRASFRTNPLILGGTSGSGGGSGTPPGGIVGQITQWNVTGDTTESFLFTPGSPTSLLDNLNNLRAWLNPPHNFWADETAPLSSQIALSSGSWYYQDGLAPLVYSGGNSPVISAPSSGSRYDLLTINSSGIFSWISSAEGDPPASLPNFPQVTSQQIPLWMVLSRSSGSVVKRYDDGSNHYLFRDYRPFLGGPTYIPSTGSAFAVYRWQTDGYLASADDFNGVYYIPDNYALTNAVVWVKVPPSSGSVIVDIQYSGDYGASWASIFTSPPSLSSGSYIVASPDSITLSTGTLLKANIIDPGVGASTISLNLLGTVTSASGGGTVTNVSVSSLNGITSSVTNPTSTPFITLGLGDITPNSVVSSGSLSGINLTGINSGDQYIVLSGDVRGEGYTAITTALAPTGVVPGVYTLSTISVDEDGRILYASTGSGTGAISFDLPLDVADTPLAGASLEASASDHVHRGVSSVSAAGGDYAYGNIQIVAGDNVSLQQSSGSITINSSSAGITLDYVSDPAIVAYSPMAGTSGSASPSDHVHAGVSGIFTGANPATTGEIQLIEGTNVTISQFGTGFTFDVASTSGVTSVSSPGGEFATGDIVLQAGTNVTITQTSGSFEISASSGSGSTEFASTAESNAGTITNKSVNPAGLPLRVESESLIHNQPYGGDARGSNAVDFQSTRSDNAQVASGNNSVISGGSSNQASGVLSSVPGGSGALANSYGQLVHASGIFASQGDAQGTVQAVFRRQIDFSVDTGEQPLFLDGSSETLVARDYSVFALEALVCASTASLDKYATWKLTASIVVKGGIMSIVASTSDKTYFSGTGANLWTAAIDGYGFGNDRIAVVVSDGQDTETIRWVATVTACELVYP